MKSRILAEDESLLVCFKPAGLAVQSGRVGEADMVSELKKYLAADTKEPYLGLIHRLDQPVSGLLVFARTPEAAAELSRQAAGKAEGRRRGSGEKRGRAKTSPAGRESLYMEKEYSALLYVQNVEALPEMGEKKTLVHYLRKEGGQNLSRIVERGTPGAKRAELELWPVEEKDRHAQARIRLVTGRHHQIRVQCAAVGLPLLGDTRYGSRESREYSARMGIRSVCLCASRLCFFHPVTGKRLEYEVEELPWEM